MSGYLAPKIDGMELCDIGNEDGCASEIEVIDSICVRSSS